MCYDAFLIGPENAYWRSESACTKNTKYHVLWCRWWKEITGHIGRVGHGLAVILFFESRDLARMDGIYP